MNCPNLNISTNPGFECHCTATRERTIVNAETANEICASDQYENCFHFQRKIISIKRAVYQEVFRAIG